MATNDIQKLEQYDLFCDGRLADPYPFFPGCLWQRAIDGMTCSRAEDRCFVARRHLFDLQ